MNKMKFKSIIFAAATLLFSTTLLYSCDDDNDVSQYPKKVKIEYSVSSKTKDIKHGELIFTDSLGKDSINKTGQVPFNTAFNRMITKSGEKAKLVFKAAGNGEIKLDIKVDNQVVKTETFKSAADSLKATIEYTF
jgi:hypothetical protein